MIQSLRRVIRRWTRTQAQVRSTLQMCCNLQTKVTYTIYFICAVGLLRALIPWRMACPQIASSKAGRGTRASKKHFYGRLYKALPWPMPQHTLGLNAAGRLSVLHFDISMTTNGHYVLYRGPLGSHSLQQLGCSPFKMLQIMFTQTAQCLVQGLLWLKENKVSVLLLASCWFDSHACFQ